MSPQTRNTIDEIIKYGQLITIIVALMLLGSWKNEIENTTFDSARQKQQVIQHIDNELIHVNPDKVEEKFVTRREYNITLKQTAKDISEIKVLLTSKKQKN